jgi:SagB-type dehydrogenase family enzyme
VPVSLAFVEGVRVAVPKVGSPRIVGPGEDLVLNRRAERIVAVFQRFVGGYATYERLTADALRCGGLDGLRALHEHLEQLFARSWIAHRLRHRSTAIITIIPASGGYPLTVRALTDGTPTLSRFALLRREDARVVMECPVAHARAIIDDPRVLGELWRLAGGEASGRQSRLPETVVRSLVDMLWSGGFLTIRDEKTATTLDERPPFSGWEFHDLLFHSRTRQGRHTAPYGATYGLRGRVEPPVAVKPPRPGANLISLPRTDLNRLLASDWTLTRALEQRRSHRSYDAQPITRDLLAELLYRSAGTRRVTIAGRSAATRRVYPSGGARYPLEIYLAARRCDGLVPGLYRYCPRRHQLEWVNGMTADVRALIDGAAAAGGSRAPQVLITIAARFLRMSWKYSSLSYALILKEVGALLQTMYLVATAMGLGACALGGGNADVFAKAAGTGYYDEGAVGELLLGARRHQAVKYSRSRAARS